MTVWLTQLDLFFIHVTGSSLVPRPLSDFILQSVEKITGVAWERGSSFSPVRHVGISLPNLPTCQLTVPGSAAIALFSSGPKIVDPKHGSC